MSTFSVSSSTEIWGGGGGGAQKVSGRMCNMYSLGELWDMFVRKSLMPLECLCNILRQKSISLSLYT